MKAATSIALALSLLTGLCVGVGVLSYRTDALIGGNVIFNTNLDPTDNPYTKIAWTVNGRDIIVLTSASNVTEPGYKDRISLDTSTGSLELTGLTLGDRGNYSVEFSISAEVILNGSTELVLHEVIVNATIKKPLATLVEDKDSTNLTCAAAGSISTREWMKDGVPLSLSDRVSLSGDNSTVGISPVNRTDNAVYLCRLSNPVSSASVSYNLVVNFGPELKTILAPEIAEVGTTTLLYCYVRSVPPAKLTWLFKGVETGVHENVYVIDESSHSDSGDYTCTASNDLTGRTQSLTHTLTIGDRPSSPALSPGAAAGIAVAVTLVVVALVVGLYCGLTYHLNSTKGSLGAGRETERKHTQQNQASHDRGHLNLQFRSHEPKIKTSRDPQEMMRTPGRETEMNHTQQNQASHDRGHLNLQFRSHEPKIKTSRDPQETMRTPVSGDRDWIYQNVSRLTTRVVEAPPLPPRTQIPRGRTRPDLESEYETKISS
ncbi:carcinoembryonic antigen-related cell adhesion molecule 5-like isoform X1 [Osmerus eperlanus]|uniref:carcinoembryonic antigen-related cell adhesion molecule 5-like isoform X1 n=1 Tax=Osmerus eperlanus TaxID=29151 RepID=UPI002E12EE0B